MIDELPWWITTYQDWHLAWPSQLKPNVEVGQSLYGMTAPKVGLKKTWPAASGLYTYRPEGIGLNKSTSKRTNSWQTVHPTCHSHTDILTFRYHKSQPGVLADVSCFAAHTPIGHGDATRVVGRQEAPVGMLLGSPRRPRGRSLGHCQSMEWFASICWINNPV